MSPILQDKLLDLLVNLISILVSGGLLILLIEWRRHSRERQQWAREEAKLEIDVLRAEMRYEPWRITEFMPDKDKLEIYENNLMDKVKKYSVVATFVIRNTTQGELVVRSYGLEENAPPGPGSRTYRVYDLLAVKFFDPNNLSPITLRPLGTTTRTILVHRDLSDVLSSSATIDTPPTNVGIYAETSEGVRAQVEKKLMGITTFPDLSWSPAGHLHLQEFLDKASDSAIEEIDKELDKLAMDEIPF